MSCCGNPLVLKGLCHLHNADIINNIELNLKLRFDWGILAAGGWINVTKDMPGPRGINDWSVLKPLDVNDGTKWIGVRKDWIYEDVTYTDLDGGTNSPLAVQIYIDDVLQVGGYSVNYQEGMVTFDDPINTFSVVQANYSYRYVQTYISNDAPWWRELQMKSFNIEDLHFSQSECGDWNIGSQHRVQMPTIIIDAIPIGTLDGYSLGESRRKITQGVLFHIFAEDKNTRNRLVDIVRLQGETTICAFNSNDAAMESALPINCGGDPTGLNYSELITEYPWPNIYLGKPIVRNLQAYSFGLYEGRVDMPLEVIFGNCGV